MTVIKKTAVLAVAIGLAAGGFCTPFHQAPEVFSLDQAIRVAVQNNPTLLSTEQDIIISQQRVNEASFLFLPQTNFSGTASKSNVKYPIVLSPDFGSHLLQPSSYENFYTARVQLVQTLYVGGRNINTLRLAQTSLKQAKTRYESVKRDVVYSVKTSFYNFMFARNNLQSAQNWQNALVGLKERIKLDPWEEIEARAMLSSIGQMVEDAQRAMISSRLEFLKALNKEQNSEVDVSGPFRPVMTDVNLDKSIVWAMELRPELKGEVYKAEMDAIAVNLALSRRSPTVQLGVSYDVVGNKFPLASNSWEGTLAIQFPLPYDFWTQIWQKKAEQRQGDIKRAEMQDKVRLEIRQAYENLIYWQNGVMSKYSSFTALKDQYDSTLNKSQASLSALRATRVLYDSEKSYLEAVKEQLSARARFEWTLGKELIQE